MIVKDELSRYLDLSIASLLEFCDEVRVLDDGSKAPTKAWLEERDGVVVLRENRPTMFQHEGAARNRSLAWALEAKPTHVLTIDADEFVADGELLRYRCVNQLHPVYTLAVEEVWETWPECLCLRVDGGWGPRYVPALWQVPARPRPLVVKEGRLATGREPTYIRNLMRLGKAPDAGTALLHFGWTKESERKARAARYAKIDGGRYHARTHLDSILVPRHRVTLEGRPWPIGLEAFREELLDRTSGRAASRPLP